MKMTRSIPAIAISAVFLGLAACSAPEQAAETPATASAQDAFFQNLTALCGQRFEGKVVTTDAQDADFASSRLLMHVRDCSDTEIRVPFWVGEDKSRTWVITRTETGLRLKHDHRDPDGTTHTLHWYGGETANEGTATRQEFPVDQESIDLFNKNDAAVSTTNVWAVEVNPDLNYVYELKRENRHMRVEFDTTKPVAE